MSGNVPNSVVGVANDEIVLRVARFQEAAGIGRNNIHSRIFIDTEELSSDFNDHRVDLDNITQGLWKGIDQRLGHCKGAAAEERGFLEPRAEYLAELPVPLICHWNGLRFHELPPLDRGIEEERSEHVAAFRRHLNHPDPVVERGLVEESGFRCSFVGEKCRRRDCAKEEKTQREPPLNSKPRGKKHVAGRGQNGEDGPGHDEDHPKPQMRDQYETGAERPDHAAQRRKHADASRRCAHPLVLRQETDEPDGERRNAG